MGVVLSVGRFRAVTDDAGVYRLELTPGRYEVAVEVTTRADRLSADRRDPRRRRGRAAGDHDVRRPGRPDDRAPRPRAGGPRRRRRRRRSSPPRRRPRPGDRRGRDRAERRGRRDRCASRSAGCRPARRGSRSSTCRSAPAWWGRGRGRVVAGGRRPGRGGDPGAAGAGAGRGVRRRRPADPVGERRGRPRAARRGARSCGSRSPATRTSVAIEVGWGARGARARRRGLDRPRAGARDGRRGRARRSWWWRGRATRPRSGATSWSSTWRRRSSRRAATGPCAPGSELRLEVVAYLEAVAVAADGPFGAVVLAEGDPGRWAGRAGGARDAPDAVVELAVRGQARRRRRRDRARSGSACWRRDAAAGRRSGVAALPRSGARGGRRPGISLPSTASPKSRGVASVTKPSVGPVVVKRVHLPPRPRARSRGTMLRGAWRRVETRRPGRTTV